MKPPVPFRLAWPATSDKEQRELRLIERESILNHKQCRDKEKGKGKETVLYDVSLHSRESPVYQCIFVLLPKKTRFPGQHALMITVARMKMFLRHP